MTVLQSIFLGALQGVAEFLPVSSSGHLVVFRNFMDLGDIPALFDILLHAATLFVVLIVFRKTILRLIKSIGKFIRRQGDEEDRLNMRLISILLIASVFTAVLGLFIEWLDISGNPKLVSVLFLVTAVVLILTRFVKNPGSGYENIGIKTAVITGIAQGIAVFPGISRSGMTISASLFSGVGRDKAGEYSFLLFIPAIMGALLLEMKDYKALGDSVSVWVMIAGMAVAFAVGMVAVLFLLKLVKKNKMHYFSFYLIPFGILSFILV